MSPIKVKVTLFAALSLAALAQCPEASLGCQGQGKGVEISVSNQVLGVCLCVLLGLPVLLLARGAVVTALILPGAQTPAFLPPVTDKGDRTPLSCPSPGKTVRSWDCAGKTLSAPSAEQGVED